MLHELSITALGVIDQARLPLHGGLTVLTGETGAGKTMVLTGLNLILGGKAAPDAVRVGVEEAVAEAVLDVPAGSEAARVATDAGVRFEEDGTVTVTRIVGAASRSRSILGGRTVPQSLLADVGSETVTVHGQADQARLRTPAKQRETLDAYAGHEHRALLARYREAWQAWNTARDDAERLRAGAGASRAEIARLREDLEAIAAVNPQAGEDEELAAEAQSLEHAETVRAGLAGAHAAVAGENEGTVLAAVESARRALADAARHDPRLDDIELRLAELSYGAADVATDLARRLDELDADPLRLDAIHARRAAIATLARRLGRPAHEIPDYANEAARRVADDDDWDRIVQEREEHVRIARAELDEAAAHVSASRQSAGQRLAAAVRGELGSLAMPDADFRVEVTPGDPGPSGADVVTMLLAAHPGAKPRPVAEAASGGELSRIMLAIEVSLAAADADGPRAGSASDIGGDVVRTFVFDEVDAGVGGRAAQAVGARLARLARTHQVLVVTHLAQVAAYADHHVVVTKATDGMVTVSHVREVSGDDRVVEIARLLSGQEDSETARAHALELLEGSSVAP
jgi:DNA repair protein RecN (Recombination protein N)